MQDSSTSGKKPIKEVEELRARKAKLERVNSSTTERKKAEEELKQSKEFLANVINALDDPVFVKDEQYRWVVLNDAACKVMGHPREELIGKTDYDLFPEEQADVFWERDTFVLKNGQTDVNEEEITWHGKLHTISTKKSVFTDSVTGKKFIAGTIRDITERKRAERLLRKERDKAQKYFDVAGIMLVAIDVEGRVGLINNKGCEILGYEEEDAIGKNWFDNFLPQRIKHQVRGVFEKLVGPEADAPEYYENLILTKDGDERLIAWHNTALRDDKGEVIATLSSGEDVTEKKQAEEALSSALAWQKAVFEGSRDAVFISDADSRFIMVNRAACELTGFPKDELLGMRIPDVHEQEDLTAYNIYHDRIMAGEEIVSEARILRKDGTKVDTEFNNRCIKISGIAYMHTVARDITERKRAEEVLKKTTYNLNERIKELNCLYGLSELVEKSNISLKEIFQGMANLIPPGWQYPDVTCARIIFENEQFKTDNFKITKWKQSADIEVHETKTGAVEVYYLQEKPESYEGPFLKEERDLIEALAERLGKITERKQVEEVLQLERDNFVNILDSMEDGVYIVDRNHDIQYVNPILKKDFGPYEERKCYEYFHDRKEVCSWCKNEEVFSGRTVRWEWYSAKNQRTYDLVDTPLRNPDGTVSKLEIFRDITERKNAEERIRGQSEFLRNTIESLSHPFYVIDANDYTIKMANTAAAGSEALPEGMTCYALTHRLDKPCASSGRLCPVEEIKKTGKPEVVEHTHYDKDGSERIFEIHAYPIFDNEGNVSQIIEYSLDITERKRAEEALRRSKQDWENTFNAISDWVVLVDLKGRILRTNRAGEKFVGVPEIQIVGQTCCKLVHGSDTPLPGCPLLKMLQSGQSETMELQLPDSNRWLTITVDPVRDKDGTLAGAVHIARDITDRKHAEQERESTIGLLHLLNATNQKHELMRLVTTFLKDWSDCEAVGIRLQEGEDFPYFVTSGFSEEFIEAENYLCSVNELGEIERDSQGRPFLECMCGNIISGRFDPSKPFFTEHGSFWTNSTTELLAGTTETDRLARTRNRCNTAGYESVALIPLRAGKETFGLLQFNDKQRGRFTPEKISLLERLADNLAIGLAQRRAEEALRESQQSLVRAQQMAHIGDWDRDFVENTVKWSEELYRIFGVSPDDFEPTYKGFLNLVHPDDRELVSKITTIAAPGKQPFSVDYRIVRPDGSECAVHSQGEVHTDNNGRVSRICGTVQDITERKRAEEVIRREKLLSDSIVDNTPAGIAFLDNDFVLRRCNNTYAEFIQTYTPYTSEQALGMSYFDYAPGSRPQVEEWFQKVVDTGQVDTRYGFKLVLKHDGQEKIGYWDTSVAPVLDAEGKAEGILILTQDVTERKQAEQKLLDDQAQLKSLASQLTLAEERERRRLATELHDRIGQSLVISKMNLEALRKSEYGKKTDETLDEICNSLAQTIADTRTLTFDLNSPILYELGFEAAVAEWLTEQIQDKHGIATEFEDDGQPKPLDDDIRVLLFRDVRELLVNVVKHANAKNVKVSIWKMDKKICVRIEDDGLGFNVTKVESMVTKKAKFGLFSIRERLESVGGHFEIESEPGHGSRITMFAPLKSK